MSLAVTVPGEVPLADLPEIEIVPIHIPRPIRPLRDLRALLRLRALFRERSFDLVHSFGPKAGLLSSCAGLLAGVPARLHTFTGQVWAARTGLGYVLLKNADRTTARMATHVLADSHSQRDFLVRERVVHRDKCQVLAAGSVSGVNVTRFKPDSAARQTVRAELGISDGSPVVLFLGRIRREKGVIDLAEAFGQMREAPGAVLIFVGPDEENLKQEIMNRCLHVSERLRFVDYTRYPERYLAASDVLCLPSYREGFGTVVIEAAAVGLPSVASRIYGITDAVLDRETGLLFESRNVQDLRQKLAEIIGNDELRKRLGVTARNRVMAEFAQEKLTAAMASFYEEILRGS